MKISRIVLSACILICAFICVSFVQEPGAMAKSPPPVPTTVVISPKSAAVAWGKEAQFTATVYDSSNKKITGLKLDWTLNDTVKGADGAPCSINKNGVLTVPNSGSDDTITISNFVKVAVSSNPSISAQADVTILGQPFAGGVFLGTEECTQGCSDSGTLAIHATATAFHALGLNDDGSGFLECRNGTIDKDGNLSAACATSDGHHVLVSGSITASGLSGTWTQPDNSSSGTWSADEKTNVVGAGPKIGTWKTPGVQPPSGPLAVIFNDDYSFTAISIRKDTNGQLEGTGFSGRWASDEISFTIDNGNTVTGGTGTYNPAKKTGSGNLYNGNTKVGTWNISDL